MRACAGRCLITRGPACTQIFGGPVIKSVAVYAGADAWGIRLQLNGNGGSLAAIGGILDFLHTYVDSKIPNQVDPVFTISGPTSGNGLPIAIGLGLTNVGYQKVSSSPCLKVNQRKGRRSTVVKCSTRPPPAPDCSFTSAPPTATARAAPAATSASA